MLNAIVSFSLRFRGIIIALACLFMVFGVFSLSKAKYDVFPEFAPPQVTVQTEALGLTPEQVEVLITQPIENSINGVPGIDSIHSQSAQGLSVIKVIFQSGSDIYRDRQLVAERLATIVSQLPVGTNPPVISPLTSATSVVLVLGLTSDKVSLMDLRSIADWTLRPRLLTVRGVANTVIFGGEVKQFQVQVSPEQLIKYHLSMDDVLNAARRSTGIRGAGFIETVNQRIVLQTQGQYMSPQTLAKTVLFYQNEEPLTLGDVAKVVEAEAPPYSGATIMGQPGVLLEISSQYGANTMEVTRDAENALKELAPALKAQGVTLHANLFRPANLIELATENVQTSLITGAILVILVLFLFLANFRSAAISCTAIPLSLLAAVSVLSSMGFTINTMTLGGLAIAIGEVVDDAVIDVENILRRLRENRHSEKPKPIYPVILDASIEVRSAVVYATFAVALVFVPILSITGVVGHLFQPLGVAYLLSIFASLLVALTVTPALCFLFLQHAEESERGAQWVGFLKERYRVLLRHVEKRARLVMVSIALMVLIGMGGLLLLNNTFLPHLREGHILVHANTVSGTSLKESLRLGGRVSRELMNLPGVRTVAQRVGRATNAEDTWGTHYTEYDIDLKPMPPEEAVKMEEKVREVFSGYPYLNADVITYLSEHLMEAISGYKAPVVVNIFGNNLDTLDMKAEEVVGLLRSIPGALDVQFQSAPSIPELVIQLREKDIARWGFNPVDVLDVIRAAYQGDIVGQIPSGNQSIGVSVVLDPSHRNQVDQVKDLPLRNTMGIYIPLKKLADIYQMSGRYEVLHQGARRVQTVTVNVAENDVKTFTEKARQVLNSKISWPAGFYAEFTGTAEADAQSRNELLLYSALAGIGIILLLSIIMGNFRNLLLVLINLPFALVGGVLAVLLTGREFSVGSMVGFVTLFGITLRNSIMLISHYQHLISEEGHIWGLDTAIRGASERLVPILMTALVTGLGLLPLAVGRDAPGREIEGAMAVVILGGLITSTVLNLVVLPTLSFRYGRFNVPSLHEEGIQIQS